ncbi:protein kinase domain-containing protein [Ampullimonas aquatilis]|uniref:protein kinase domain-containing protein n=1 Tax=Ampullimonas aquatilis TaxID=1341549 RepID=UPI003C754F90
MLGKERLHSGMIIDGFKLEERLHQGGMASLWKVTSPDLAEPAIMKTPMLLDDSDPTAIVSFEVEQMIMPLLTGIHVPKFIAQGGFEDQPYIVMEMIAGDSLRARFDEAPLTSDEVASIGAKIATALHDLHRQHVIHLDLKHSNVMFRHKPDGQLGEVVLIDFGLAHHDRLPDLLAEQFRLPMGTGPYISPEQVRQIRTDSRSDLFALGVLLYHLITGIRPFGFPTTVRGLQRRLYAKPKPPASINPSCPPWLQEVILHCLEVNPDERYASAAQVALDLQHPDAVVITDRADRQINTGVIGKFRRWFRMMNHEAPTQTVSTQLANAAIVMAAVDLSQEWEELADMVRHVVQRILRATPGARLACVTVLKTSRIGMDDHRDEDGRHLHVKKLIELKHWARPLELPPDLITYHVLNDPDAATAILDYAHTNQADHIVLGSRGPSALKRYLGSVSAEVVTKANCTVTVVKVNSSGMADNAAAVDNLEDDDYVPF